MSQNLELSKEETAVLDRIQAELSPQAMAKAEAVDLKELCKKYRAIRPLLEKLVEIVKKIPKIGEKIAAVLQFLMGLADIACPV
jgi:hypothetical protein